MEIELLPITKATASSRADSVLGGSEPSEVAALVGQVADAQLALYRRTGATAPWIGYFAREATSRELLGSCSFVGPLQEGCVEIAYLTFPHAEGRGVAKQMAGMLLGIARTNAQASAVIAHTLPEENASTRVLKSLGFAVIGSAVDDEAGCVWKWQLDLKGVAPASGRKQLLELGPAPEGKERFAVPHRKPNGPKAATPRHGCCAPASGVRRVIAAALKRTSIA